MTDEVVVISPELDPGAGGVGDNTLRLIEQWSNCRQLRVLVARKTDVERLGRYRVEQLARGASAIYRQLPPAAGRVLLEYSAYGFNHIGYPRALISALLSWKKKTGGLFVILFHEIWTFWPTFNKNAVVQFFHRRAIKQLLNASDAVFTTTQSQAEHLNRLCSRRSIEVLPAGSNIRRRSTMDRPRRRNTAVLFGLQYARISTLRKMQSSLRALAAAGRISEIITVGGGAADNDQELKLLLDLGLAHGFEQRGSQSEDTISQLFLTAGFAISGQDELSFEKSSSFMAYAEHELNVLSDSAGLQKKEPSCWLVAPAELLQGLPETELKERARLLCDWQKRTSSWELIAARVGHGLGLNQTDLPLDQSAAG